MKQLEFDFAEEWIERDREKQEAHQKSFESLVKTIMKIAPTFKEIYPDNLWNGIFENDNSCPSIPITIVKGTKNQPEFNFVKDIDKKAWKDIDVEYLYER